MEFITFTKDLEMGIKIIDEQHHELINRINALASCHSFAPAEVQKTIDLLSEYVGKHFADEQDLHIKTNYPKKDEHKLLHQEFTNDFEKMKNNFSKNDDIFKFSLDLTQFIVAWAIRHIKVADVEFSIYYKENFEENV